MQLTWIESQARIKKLEDENKELKAILTGIAKIIKHQEDIKKVLG
jgi:hypothetical protein